METVQRATDANLVEDKWLKVGEILILPSREALDLENDQPGSIGLNNNNKIIYKGKDGKLREIEASYSVSLSKESVALSTELGGGIGSAQLAKTSSKITALAGSSTLVGVGQNAVPTKGQFRYKITSVAGGTATRVDNTTFRLTSITDDVAQVNVEVLLENQTTVNKVMSVAKLQPGLPGEPGEPGKDGAQGPQGPPGDGAEIDLEEVEAIIDKQLEQFNQVIADIAADNKVTSSEKLTLRLEVNKIQNEYQTIYDQATLYQLTSLRTEYETAYLSLLTYITPILANNETVTIVPATFQSRFSTYYAKRSNLQKAIITNIKNNADQTKLTAEGVEKITNFWKITLDDQSGLIAAGTMLVGTATQNNAGMTGVTDNGADSVRFFAGAPYQQKNSAPFRVLNNGKLWLGDNSYGMDWSITKPNTLTIRGAMVLDPGGNRGDIPIFRGVWDSTTTYYKGNIVTYDGSSWYFINDVPGNSTPVVGTNWIVYAEKGANGESSFVEIQYSVDGVNAWHNVFTAGDVFMRQRTGQTTWSNAIRIVGEAGAVGPDGKYTSYEFAKNTSLTVGPTTGWTDGPPTLSANEYLWTRIGKFGPAGQIGTWSNPVRLTGPQGEPGVSGPPGSSLFTWVKYADNASGGGMSDYPAGKMYIGLAYNKPIANESENPSDYSWALIVGQGVAGPPGEDGRDTYTWIKYADSPTTGMSDDPTGKRYLGIAYNKETANESTSYSDYSWSLIRGNDGAPGAPGADGKYTEFRFAKNGSPTAAPGVDNSNANPSGWSTVQPTLNPLEYMWMISAVKNADGSLSGTWGAPVRTSGKDGTNGSNGQAGPTGPFVLGRGAWEAGKSYYGGTDRVEVVKYNNTWYVTRGDAGNIATGTLPTDGSKWNTFAGQFESVATNLLFATMAYVDNLGVKYLRTADTGKRVEINGNNNNFTLYDGSNRELIVIDDDAAITGYTLNNDPPYNLQPIYGPGIAIGIKGSNKYTSISENAITTNGTITASESISSFGPVDGKYFISEVLQGTGNLPSSGLVLALGNCNLFTLPTDGQVQTIKNRHTGQITLSAAQSTGRNILRLDNAVVFSVLLPAGAVASFQYHEATNLWVQLSYNIQA